MFIRTKTTKNSPRKSVQIVESVRIGSKVKQNIIKHIGIAKDDKELEELKLLAQTIKEQIEKDEKTQLITPEQLANKEAVSAKKLQDSAKDYNVNLQDIVEEARVIKGIHDVYGKLYDDLGFNKIISSTNKSALPAILKNIVMARIATPESKRKTVSMLENQFGISLQLDKVYRMMDKLDDKAIEKINKIAFTQTNKLLHEKIDVIFFDATTIYFESFSEDEFRKNGYSKDLKFNQPQVVIALMVTTEGLPIGYEAFSGDTFEGHTLIPALKRLREKYNVKNVVYVADSGMFNKNNLAELDNLEQEKINYIVGARIKNLPKLLTKQILKPSNYTKINDEIKVATFEHNNRKLVVSYSAKRARKDAHDREKGIEKLRKKLAKSKSVKTQLSNQGYKKYLTITGESSININEEKIKEDAKWDGLKGLIVDKHNNLRNEEILQQYSNLWQVEESFRITKHDLKIRPVYHFKKERVKAHLAISFMAYSLVRHLEYRVRLQYVKLSPEKIRQILLSIQVSIFYCNKKKMRYAMPSSISVEATKIYKLMGVKVQKKAYII